MLGAPAAPPPPPPTIAVVPQPVAVQGVRGDAFELAPDARIGSVDADPMEAGEVAEQLATLLRAASAFELPIVRGETRTRRHRARIGRGRGTRGPRSRGIRAALRSGRRSHRREHGGRPVERDADPAPAASGSDRERTAARRSARGRRRRDHRLPPVRLSQCDARRGPPLLHHRRGGAVHRRDRDAEDQHASHACLERSGLAHRDQGVAAAERDRRPVRGGRRPGWLPPRRGSQASSSTPQHATS